MTVRDLLTNIVHDITGAGLDREVTSLTQDSRAVAPGVVFVAIRGTNSDGHDYLATAATNGAAALIVEDRDRVPSSYQGVIVHVRDARATFARLAERYYGYPARELFCVGVTGTNGKTTVTYMIEKIFNHAQRPTGVMGTIDHHLQDKRWPSALTTPDALTLQKRLREFVDLGASAAAFEVSSHALEQKRADGLPFAVGIFTNFTRDHLDYHHTMEAYFAAKEKLVNECLGAHPTTAVAVLNGDDPAIRRVRVRQGVTRWWYGTSADANLRFELLSQDLNGSRFHLTTPRGDAHILLPSPGVHNVYNATAAIGAALAAGIDLDIAANALARFHGAPGRLEKVPNTRGLHIFVDYAHTDDAVATVLGAIRRVQGESSGRVITVFGCGGDRDRGKRPLMAKAACAGSDEVIVTSDNPRTENPDAILDDILKGVPATFTGQVRRERDRRAAIAMALQSAREGDVILIAGKGHEDYQILGTERVSFSDQNVVRELLKD